MANLAQLLQRIEQGQTLNYERLLKLLPKDVQLDHSFVFAPTKVGVRSYRVKVLDQDRFKALLAQYIQPADRSQAAMVGDSHQVATSCGFILVFHQGLDHDRPDVVVTDKNGYDQGFVAKKTLLIIENQECFFAYRRLLPLLSSFYSGEPQQLDLNQCDIAYGAGNCINKGLNLSWFGQYHSVLCAFDYDLGGLRMFNTLKSKLSAAVYWLQADDLEALASKFKKPPQDHQQLLQALDLASALGLDPLAAMFKQTGLFLEQEVLLT